VAAQIAIAKRAPPASAGEGGQEPASGAPAHDVLRLDGGDAVPPESKPAAERPPANLDRRQNCRASPPAAELPCIPPGGRVAGRESRPAAELPGHLHRWQFARATQPAAGWPDANLDRRQNCRASPPVAVRPSHSPGARAARRESQPAAEQPGISTGGRAARREPQGETNLTLRLQLAETACRHVHPWPQLHQERRHETPAQRQSQRPVKVPRRA
jgi:hypothetical protein